MVQPVTTCHKGFVTLHVGSGHIHQTCGAVVDLRICIYCPDEYKQA
jgi:hypothetical protein